VTHPLERIDTAVLEPQERLELQQGAEKRRCPTDAPSLVQVLERVHRKDGLLLGNGFVRRGAHLLEIPAQVAGVHRGLDRQLQCRGSATRVHYLDGHFWQLLGGEER